MNLSDRILRVVEKKIRALSDEERARAVMWAMLRDMNETSFPRYLELARVDCALEVDGLERFKRVLELISDCDWG